MIRKSLFILIITVNCLHGQAQYLDHKMEIGMGAGFSYPLNASELTLDEGFVYPSLFGNYSFGAGINAWVNYHLNKALRLGIQLEGSYYPSWSGDQEIFILSEPTLLLLPLSFNAYYLPDKLQLARPSIKWGCFAAPVLSFQVLEWEAIDQDNSGQMPSSSTAWDVGAKAGICFFSEINNSSGLRLDLYYQYIRTESLYYLDDAFHSVNVSLGFFFKKLQNRHFRYD